MVVDSDGERIVIPRHDPAMPNDASWLPLQRIRDGEFAAVLTEVRWPEGAAAVLDAARHAADIPAILDAEVGAPGVLEDLARRATHVLYSETGLDAHVGTGDAGGQLVRAQTALPHAFVGVTRGAEGFYWLQDGRLGTPRASRSMRWTRWAPATCSTAPTRWRWRKGKNRRTQRGFPASPRASGARGVRWSHRRADAGRCAGPDVVVVRQGPTPTESAFCRNRQRHRPTCRFLYKPTLG